MKKTMTLMIGFMILTACVATKPNGPDGEHGMDKAFKGLANLVLSPVQIALGIAEGISSVPFYLAASVQEINSGLISAKSKITLDDTYEAAYGKRLKDVNPTGDTGEVFRRMKHASVYFQKVLKQYGIPDYGNYYLTSIDTANSSGYTLFAVIHRPFSSIEVVDKYDGRTLRSFTSDDRLFYEPFKVSSKGKPLDTIIDWTGINRKFVETQKGQAVLLTMASNSVINEKRSPEYWNIEKQWISGRFMDVVTHRMAAVRTKMQVQSEPSEL